MSPSHRVALLGLPLVLAAFAAEGRFGTTQYRLAGTEYAVPHAYEFSLRFLLPRLDALPGLGREPEDSPWLLLPAAEVAVGLAGYSPLSHGHAAPFAADLVAQVVGDPNGRHFASPPRPALGKFSMRGCPQTCGGVRTGIYLERDIDPVCNDQKIDLSLVAPGFRSYGKTLDRVRSDCRSR